MSKSERKSIIIKVENIDEKRRTDGGKSSTSGDPCAAIWTAFDEQNVHCFVPVSQCGKIAVKNGV